MITTVAQQSQAFDSSVRGSSGVIAATFDPLKSKSEEMKDPESDESKLSKQEIVDSLKEASKAFNYRLSFKLNEESKQTIIDVFDQNDKFIRQIPKPTAIELINRVRENYFETFSTIRTVA